MTDLRDEIGRLLLPFLDESMTYAQSCQLADQLIRAVRNGNGAATTVVRQRVPFTIVDEYGPVSEAALAAGSRRAKTPKAVECEASHSGPQGNARKPHP